MSAVLVYIQHSLSSNMASTNTTTTASTTSTQTELPTRYSVSVFKYTTPVNDFVYWLNDTFDHTNPDHLELCQVLLQRLYDWHLYSVMPVYRGRPTTVLESLAGKKAYELMCTASRLGFVQSSDVDVVGQLPLSTAGRSVLFYNCFSAMSKRYTDIDYEFIDNIKRLIEYHDMCRLLRESNRDLELSLRREKLQYQSLRSRYDALSHRVRTSSKSSTTRVAPTTTTTTTAPPVARVPAPPAPPARVPAPPAPPARVSAQPAPPKQPTSYLKRDRDFSHAAESSRNVAPATIHQMAENLVEKRRNEDNSCKRLRAERAERAE
jgi:hypothetical protein